MKRFLLVLTLAVGNCSSQALPADPEPIHLLMASRVTNSFGAELSPWVVDIDLMKDVKRNADGKPAESITSYSVNFAKLKVNGVAYDWKKSSWAEAHHEIFQWYSLNWPVGLVESDGWLDLVPLKGKQKLTHEQSFPVHCQETRAQFVKSLPPGWLGADLPTLRKLNAEFDKTAPKVEPEKPNMLPSHRPYQRPRIFIGPRRID